MPGSTTTKAFYYVYVLQSLQSPYRYIGFTTELRKRLQEHNQGLSISTKPYRPFRIIFFEGCRSKIDARRREKYLKTTGGRRFLAKRLKNYLFQE